MRVYINLENTAQGKVPQLLSYKLLSLNMCLKRTY